MAEVKEYIAKSDDSGSVSISEEVIASIAAIAASEIDGVAALGLPGMDISEFLGMKSPTKGVKIQIGEESTDISISLIVKKGAIIPSVAKSVQKSVASAVESMAGLKVGTVNVKVCGVVFEKDTKKKKTEKEPDKAEK